MKYCQFENTVMAMEECIESLEAEKWDIENMKQEASSDFEVNAMTKFVKLCKQVAEEVIDE